MQQPRHAIRVTVGCVHTTDIDASHLLQIVAHGDESVGGLAPAQTRPSAEGDLLGEPSEREPRIGHGDHGALE